MNNLLYTKNPVIFFDGECNLCSTTIQFVIKRDRNRRFKFAALQSSIGQNVLNSQGLSTKDLSTLLLLQDGIVYTRSTAALRITRHLSGIWPMLYVLLLIPPIIRNAIYSFIARNRYRLAGKNHICWVPTPELKELFIIA